MVESFFDSPPRWYLLIDLPSKMVALLLLYGWRGESGRVRGLVLIVVAVTANILVGKVLRKTDPTPSISSV